MRTALLSILLGLSPWILVGSNSLVVADGLFNHATTPSGVTQWKALGSFRIDLTVTNFVIDTGSAHYFLRFNGQNAILCDGVNFATYGPGGIGQGFFAAGNSQNFRLRYRRDTANALYSLERWDEDTGAYTVITFVDPSPGTLYDYSNMQVGIGDLNGGKTVTGKIGAVRIYNSAGALGAALPDRFITSNYGSMANWEFENNVTDAGLYGMTVGSFSSGPTYAATPTYKPVPTVTNTPATIRTGVMVSLAINGFTNSDDPTFTSLVNQTAGPAPGTFRNQTSLTPLFSGPVFGQYDLVAVIKDAGGLSSTPTAFSIGAVDTDNNGVVIIPNANIARLIGLSKRHQANSWGWFDFVAQYTADHQIYQQTHNAPHEGDSQGWWQSYWDVASTHGTVTVTNGAGSNPNAITAATNASVVTFTATVTWPLPVGGQFNVLVAGASLLWTQINGTFTATVTDATHFTIPVNSTLLGPLTGSPTYSNTALGSIIGSGTQFQTDFCGGGTTPSVSTSRSVVWYPSIEYPGTIGRAWNNITTCDSQTVLTINFPWTRTIGSSICPTVCAGLSYNVDPTDITGGWTINNTPGNYYDNALAFLALYYRSGLTKYRDAFIFLIRNFWRGPLMDRGKNFDSSTSGGVYVISDASRAIAAVGLILWYLETGENIWPGMHFIWNQQSTIWSNGVSNSWHVQLGDLRSAGITTSLYGLCSQYDTDATVRSTCHGWLTDVLTNMWIPLQLTPTATKGNWANTVILGPNYGGQTGTPFVTVTNGSKNITLTGSSWSGGSFLNGNYTSTLTAITAATNANPASLTVTWLSSPPTAGTTMHVQISGAGGGWAGINGGWVATIVDSTHMTIPIDSTGFGALAGSPVYVFDYHSPLWFYSPSTLGSQLPGNKNSDVGGDPDYYFVSDVTDGTHAILNRNYSNSSGDKGMTVSAFAGFGTQGFMQGLWGGAAGSYVYDALVFNNDTALAAIVKQWPAQSTNWLTNSGRQTNWVIGGGTDFLNCIADPLDVSCDAQNDVTLVQESINSFNLAYTLTPSAQIKSDGDNFFTRGFCKPNSGFNCGTPGFTGPDPQTQYYWWPIDPAVSGYMQGVGPQTNKWFGYCFGYGKCYSWDAVRIGGLAPVDPLTLATVGVLPANANNIRITVKDPNGIVATPVVCTGTPGQAQSCGWTGDRRQGPHLVKTDYTTSGGVVVAGGSYQTVNVQ